MATNRIRRRKYAKLSWTAEDVQSISPNLTKRQAAEWLARNERHIRDRLTEKGWEVMATLLTIDGVELSQP